MDRMYRIFQAIKAGGFPNRTPLAREIEVLSFDCKKLNSTSFERRTIEPYQMACIQNQWYCFRIDLRRRAIRTFVLARISGHRQTFIKSERFSLLKFLKGSLGVFAGKGKCSIHICFDAFAAQLVGERVWHTGQQIQELTGGEIEFRVTLSSLQEIEPWILKWGVHAQVLGPTELIERLREIALKQVALYS